MIDVERPLKLSRQTIGIAEIPITGPAQFYGLAEDSLDGPEQFLPLCLSKRPRQACRQNTSEKERFAPIDVADAGDQVLIQENDAYERAFLFLKHGIESCLIQMWRQRIYPQHRDALQLFHFSCFHTAEPAEFAHIGKLNRRPVRKSEDLMDVAIDRIFRKYRGLPIALIFHEEVPGHLQMDDERVSVIEIDDDVLTETPRTDDDSAPHIPRQRRIRRQNLFLPIAPKTRDRLADHLFLELRYDSLDFW